ncbi:hypothetical protein JKY79_01540 [Candidatus Babeliales bacterium]|nr:hypothetical protein [Candidatus Babeliales bacterium]
MTSHRLFILFFLLSNATKAVAADKIYLPSEKPCSLNTYYPIETFISPLANPIAEESIIAQCPSSDNVQFMLQYLKTICEDNSAETKDDCMLGIYVDVNARKLGYSVMETALPHIIQNPTGTKFLNLCLIFTERVIGSLRHLGAIKYETNSTITCSDMKTYNLSTIETESMDSNEKKFLESLFSFNNYTFEQLALKKLLKREKIINVISIPDDDPKNFFDLCFLQTSKGILSFVIDTSISFNIDEIFTPTEESVTGYTMITLIHQLSKKSGIFFRETSKHQIEVFFYHGASSNTPCTTKSIGILQESKGVWEKIEYKQTCNAGQSGFIPLMEEGNKLSSILSNIALLEELKESLRSKKVDMLTNAYQSIINQKKIERISKEEEKEELKVQQDHNIEQIESIEKIDATIEKLSNQATEIIETELTEKEIQKVQMNSTWLPDPIKTSKKKKKTTGKKSKKPRVQEKNKNKKDNKSNENDKSKIERIIPSLPKKTVAEIKKKAQKILASHKVENRLKMRTFYSVFNSIIKETDALTETYDLDEDASSTNIVGSHITIHGNEGAATFVKKHGSGDNKMRPNEVNTFFAKYLESRLKVLSEN